MLRRHAVAVCGLLVVLGCAKDVALQEGGAELMPLIGSDGTYTLVNLHPDEARGKLYAVNYQQEGLIPLCSEVRLESVTAKRLSFTLLETGKAYTYDYHKAAVEPFPAHLNRYFGRTCHREEVSQLSAVDREGIRTGKALKGMTRQGVIYATGYPPPHRTPNLDGERWVYWTNRFNTLAVVFGSDGLVSHIEE